MKKNEEIKEEVITTKIKKKKAESEENLSMTRELKFKELQDQIDEEEADRIVEEAIRKSKKKVKKEELTSELEKEIDEMLEVETKKSKKKKKIEVEKVEEELDQLLGKEEKVEEVQVTDDEVKITKVNIEDDLYLTSSFKPLKSRMKVSKVFKFIFKLIFTLGILGAFIYFILLPVYKMIEDSKPKAIFENTIDYVQEQIYTYIDSGVELNENNFAFDAIFDVDTNIKDKEMLTDNSFVFNYDLDTDKKIKQAVLMVENEDKVRHGFTYLTQGNVGYTKYSTSDNYLKVGYVEKEDEVLDKLYVNKDYKYYVETIVKNLKDVINEEDIVASREELEIDGFTVQVVRNSLQLKKTKLENYENELKNKLLKDEKYLNIEAAIFKKTLEEVKDVYKKKSEYKDDYSLTINIYTTKGNKFVGFDVEINGFRNYYFYKYENKFEAHVNLPTDIKCIIDRKCETGARKVVDLIGTTKGDETKVDVFLDNEDLGSLEIVKFNTKEIEFDFNIILDDIKYQGDAYVSFDKKDKNGNVNFSVDYDEQYLKLNIEFVFGNIRDIGISEESEILEYTEKLNNKEVNEFYKVTRNLDMAEAYDYYAGLLSKFRRDKKDESSKV